ncbi:MAG: AAA family ATPase, partial [Pseudonocardiales bacterium]|nr:AAA family ATPase [Pseudonocardiales bacterium]
MGSAPGIRTVRRSSGPGRAGGLARIDPLRLLTWKVLCDLARIWASPTHILAVQRHLSAVQHTATTKSLGLNFTDVLHRRVTCADRRYPVVRTPARGSVGVAPDAIVGRWRELDALRAWLDAARGGAGRLILCAGEPGIGKSRLAREFAGMAL